MSAIEFQWTRYLNIATERKCGPNLSPARPGGKCQSIEISLRGVFLLTVKEASKTIYKIMKLTCEGSCTLYTCNQCMQDCRHSKDTADHNKSASQGKALHFHICWRHWLEQNLLAAALPATCQLAFAPFVRTPATIFKSTNFRRKTRLQFDFHK